MFQDIFYIITSQNIALCNNNDQTCFSDTLTSTGPLRRGRNPHFSGSGFNISLGARQMLMHRKSCLIPIIILFQGRKQYQKTKQATLVLQSYTRGWKVGGKKKFSLLTRNFPTRSDTNQAVLPQGLPRDLKFRIKNLHILYYLSSKQQMSRVMRKPTFWFPTWSDTNQAVQLQKMAGGLKFRI